MFKKIICNNCKNKVSDKYSFCPYCGNPLSKNFKSNKKSNKNKDYGMLGENDSDTNFIEGEIILPKGIEKMMNSLLKNLNLEINEVLDQEDMNNMNKNNKINSSNFKENPYKNSQGFSISFSNLNQNPKINIIPINKISNNQNMNNFKEKEEKLIKTLTKEQIEKFSKLKKEEPKTEIRRFSDVLVYEFLIPEVNSLEDISLLKLENSIELKAIGKDISYKKIIPINNPIKDYSFSNGKLILEFSIKN
ncbi:hypothetical protein GYA25_03215 [Candidatus Woesearchaeota archaeon]|jgi:hypothetical protein|nr:hypothetical protein [Candidatus Woesearchaeota archaeon]